jgi:Spy/CpxP family protein refolding chaperone
MKIPAMLLLLAVAAHPAHGSPPPPGAPEAATEPTSRVVRLRDRPVTAATGLAMDWLASPIQMLGNLFPPTLVMEQQDTLALSDAQVARIKDAMRTFQSDVVDVQWDLQAAQSRFNEVLQADEIDAATADQAVEQVLTQENRLKKLHLTMLIEVRNALTPEQRRQLEDNRGGRVLMRAMPGLPAIPMPPVPPAHFEFRAE